MKYYVKVGEKELELDIDGQTVALNGETVTARIEDLVGTPMHVLVIGMQTYRVIARRGEGKGQYDVSIDGYRIPVEALDERSRAIRDLAGTKPQRATSVHLLAPMPGLIVRVSVAEGERVRAGQGLVVMEAMKMENELKASVAGVVKRVLVSAGSAVEKGALLLQLE